MTFMDDVRQDSQEDDEFPQIAFQQTPKDISTFIYQLDPVDIITELRHNLMNETYNADKKKWMSKGTPKINEQGVNDIIDSVQSVVNKNTFLSDLDEDKIYDIMRILHVDIAALLFTNFYKYKIHKNHLTQILWTPLLLLFPALKRAESGKTLKSLTQMHQIVEQIKRGDHKPEKKHRFGLFG